MYYEFFVLHFTCYIGILYVEYYVMLGPAYEGSILDYAAPFLF